MKLEVNEQRLRSYIFIYGTYSVSSIQSRVFANRRSPNSYFVRASSHMCLFSVASLSDDSEKKYCVENALETKNMQVIITNMNKL